MIRRDRDEIVLLKYHDVAVFKNHILDGPEKPIADREMISHLHFFLNNFAGKNGIKFLPSERVKTAKDIKIIEMVMRAVKEQMVSLKRSKIIEVPLPFVHLVPEGVVCKDDSAFGGIVVERAADDVIFSVKLFQKVFERMSYSAVKVCNERQIAYVDVGNSFKEAVASFQSREFLKEVVRKSPLFESKEAIPDEKLFNLEAEMTFNMELDDLWERNGRILPREMFFQNMVEATINGRIVPMMFLKDRKVDLKEAQAMLFMINGAGTRMF